MRNLNINPQPPNDAYWHFSGLLQFQSFFDHLLLLLEKKIKFLKFCIKFPVKQANFCRLSVLVCRSAANQTAKLPAFLKNFKRLRALRVKGAAKLCFTYYSCVVSILFGTGLHKSAFSTYFFGKTRFSSFLFLYFWLLAFCIFTLKLNNIA